MRPCVSGRLSRDSSSCSSMHGGVAARADAVAELRPRLRRDVALDVLPVVLVVANLATVRADGQVGPQRLDLGECGLQLDDEALPLGLGGLVGRHVTRDRVDDAAIEIGRGIPQQPAPGAVLAQVPVLERARLATGLDLAVLFEGALAILRVDELDGRARHQLGAGEAERHLPRGVEATEIAREVGIAQQIERQLEEPVLHVDRRTSRRIRPEWVIVESRPAEPSLRS